MISPNEYPLHILPPRGLHAPSVRAARRNSPVAPYLALLACKRNRHGGGHALPFAYVGRTRVIGVLGERVLTDLYLVRE